MTIQGLYGNQILTGAQIVQSRHSLESLAVGGEIYERSCRPRGLAQVLAAECSQLRSEAVAQRVSDAASSGSGRRTANGRFSRADAKGRRMPYIGVDPAFVSSKLLYNPQVSCSHSQPAVCCRTVLYQEMFWDLHVGQQGMDLPM